MTTPHRRRIMGLALGALLGFAYGLSSQLVNRLALPGIPLYQPPFGPLGNVLLSTLAGAGLGLITTWPHSAGWGVALGSLAAGVAIVANGLLRLAGEVSASMTLVVGIVLSVPLTWLAVPVVALLRWAADRQEEAERDEVPLPQRLRVPVALALVMALLGAFELMSDASQAQLRHMNGMMQAALAAASSESWPEPLRSPAVTAAPGRAHARYTLEWTNQDLDRFIELRPASNYDQHAAVIARFGAETNLVCLYPGRNSGPACGNY
jgi:hypothetical protein